MQFRAPGKLAIEFQSVRLYSDAITNTYGDCYGDRHCYCYFHSNGNSYSYCYLHANRNRHGHSYSDSNSNRYRYCTQRQQGHP